MSKTTYSREFFSSTEEELYSSFHASESSMATIRTTNTYSMPKWEYIIPTEPYVNRINMRVGEPNLPARLDNPLIPYDDLTRSKLMETPPSININLDNNNYTAIYYLLETYEKEKFLDSSWSYPLLTKIEDLKAFTRERLNAGAHSTVCSAEFLAENGLTTEMKEYMNRSPPLMGTLNRSSWSIEFAMMIQKIRTLLSINNKSNYNIMTDINYAKTESNVHIFTTKNKGGDHQIILSGNHFIISSRQSCTSWIGPAVYLDYLFTIADVEINVMNITRCGEYNKISNLLKLMVDLVKSNKPHNRLVTFFKNYEALCLYACDIRTSSIVNWVPIKEVIDEMIVIDDELSGSTMVRDDIYACLIGNRGTSTSLGIMSTLINTFSRLTPLELTEISALHKFLFFAEVDSKAGIEKFMKRTHTKRNVEPEQMQMLIALMKMKFVKGFLKRTKSLPPIEYPSDKSQHLMQLYESGRINDAFLHPLLWWYDIEIGSCIMDLRTGNPIEYAKDKGSISYDNDYGPQSSIKELVQVLISEDYQAEDLDDLHNLQPKERKIKNILRVERTHKIRFPIRLCEKEKEQKIEARLFGVTTAPIKHAISRVTSKMKKALSYFDNQYMTMTAEDRANSMHRLGQLQRSPDTIGILLDIEGHNQSMQRDNTYEIAEFIGRLYGEYGWGEMSTLFSKAEVYHANAYTREVVISTGQFGGIEGWYNPLWTLVTLLQCELLEYTTAVKPIMIATYSDDVAIVINKKDMEGLDLDQTLSIISDDFARLGFVVKPSQCAVTESRSTLLRQHFVYGEAADSVLKRILSMSIAENQRFSSDEDEIASLSSSASSAMENSNHIITITYNKWFKAGLVTHHSILELLSKKREDSLVSYERLPENIRNLIEPVDLLKSQPDEEYSKRVAAGMIDYFSELEKIYKTSEYGEIYREFISTITNSTLREELMKLTKESLSYLTMSSVYLSELWLMLLMLPASVGGFGLALLPTQLLSGHSDHLARTYDIIIKYIKDTFTEKRMCYEILQYSLKSYEETESLPYKYRMIDNKWLTNRKIRTTRSVVNNKLKLIMRDLCRNKEVKKLLEADEEMQGIKNAITDIFSNNYCQRVAEFYKDNTAQGLINKIIRKLETSSSLLKRMKRFKDFQADMTVQSVINIQLLLSTKGRVFGGISRNTDIVDYLCQRRGIVVENINFVDIEEPVYMNRIIPVRAPDCLVQIFPANPHLFKDDLWQLKKGSSQSVTLFKGEHLEDEPEFGNMETMIVAKLVSVTKWILVKSNQFDEQNINMNLVDVVQACNISLSTITSKEFSDLAMMVPMNLRGEILHRIPNSSFKPSVTIRVLPNATRDMSTRLNQSVINDADLIDSNINFEYLRKWLLVKRAVAKSISKIEVGWESYGFNSYSTVRDARDYTAEITDKTNFICEKNCQSLFSSRLEIMKISKYTAAYLYSDNTIDYFLNSHEDNEYNDAMTVLNLEEEIIMRYYNAMLREHMIIDLEIINYELFGSLCERLRKSIKRHEGKSDEEMIPHIKDTIYRVERSIIATSLDKVTDYEVRKSLSQLCVIAQEENAPYLYFKNLASAFATNVYDDGILEQKIARIVEVNEESEEFVRAFIIDMIYIHCIYVNPKGSSDVINIRQTMENAESFLENPLTRSDLSPASRMFVHAIKLRELTTIFSINFNYIEEKLQSINDDVTFQNTLKLSESIKPEVVRILDESRHLPRDIFSVGYDAIEIRMKSELDYINLSHSLTVSKTVSELYADPMTNFSITGSDSLVGQIGLLKMLKTKKFYKDGDKIASLTSGRGDIIHASKATGVKCEAFSRLTQFTSIMVSKEVKILPDLDITKEFDINEITDARLILIDISHIEGDKSSLYNNIINWATEGKTVIIRANSIVRGEEKGFRNLLKEINQIFYALPITNSIMPYQQYFILTNDNMTPGYGKLEMDSDDLYKEIWERYNKLISYKRLSLIARRDMETSYTALLDKSLGLNDLIELISSKAELDMSRRTIRQILNSELPIQTMLIDNDSYKRFSVVTKKDIWFDQISEVPIYYDDISDRDIGDKKQKGFHYWKRTITNIINTKTRFSEINLADLELDELEELSRILPTRKLRGHMLSLKSTAHTTGDIRGMTEEELVNELRYLDSRRSKDRSSKNKLLLDAIYLLAYAATNNNYSAGIELLLSSASEAKNTRVRRMEILKIYRSIGSLYHQFVGELRSQKIKLSTINKINEYVTTNFIIQKRRILIGDNTEAINEEIEWITKMREEFNNFKLSDLVSFTEKLVPTLAVATDSDFLLDHTEISLTMPSVYSGIHDEIAINAIDIAGVFGAGLLDVEEFNRTTAERIRVADEDVLQGQTFAQMYEMSAEDYYDGDDDDYDYEGENDEDNP
uniref:RNA-directed RNA polymerase n=1 Tax=Grapevine-associated serpento-like virus 1 TaxID=2814414 RepID=A0A8F5MJN9_9VIRU|nr:MAG: RNA-dependent RNA polymerase [Grapevine-associated serpento-like virus 1]